MGALQSSNLSIFIIAQFYDILILGKIFDAILKISLLSMQIAYKLKNRIFFGENMTWGKCQNFNFATPPLPRPCLDFGNFLIFKIVLSRPFRKPIFCWDYWKKVIFSKFEKISILYYAFIFVPKIVFSIIPTKCGFSESHWENLLRNDFFWKSKKGRGNGGVAKLKFWHFPQIIFSPKMIRFLNL